MITVFLYNLQINYSTFQNVYPFIMFTNKTKYLEQNCVSNVVISVLTALLSNICSSRISAVKFTDD
jgi:hypothetical protein